MNNIPIDIHHAKLLEWILSRRHCPEDWHENVKLIRYKISSNLPNILNKDGSAFQDFNFSHRDFNYFDCIKLLTVLEKTEASSKNLFGSYTSETMKVWQEIKKLYEKGNVFLAESAQFLHRNVNYEIPFIRKQITKMQLAQENSKKKAISCAKTIKDLKNKYTTMCKDYRIEGNNIRNEIYSITKDLPSLLEKISNISSLVPAIAYYEEFLTFSLNFNKMSKEIQVEGLFPVTKYLKEKGNTTVYEFVYKKPPVEVLKPKLYDENQTTMEAFENDEIDWDVDLNEAEIDFGIEVISDAATDSTDHSSPIVLETFDPQLSPEKTEDGIAKNDEALFLLEHNQYRTDFITELLQLKAFLHSRLRDISSGDSDMLIGIIMNSAPSNIQSIGEKSLNEMLASVEKILELLTSSHATHLFTLVDNPTYCDRILESVEGVRKSINRAEQALHMANDAEKNAAETEAELHPKLQLFLNETKILQKQIAGEISKKYDNRPVNIMGDMTLA